MGRILPMGEEGGSAWGVGGWPPGWSEMAGWVV